MEGPPFTPFDEPLSQPTAWDGLSPETAALVDAFAAALKAKLRRAEIKYGYGVGWRSNDWEADCRRQLTEHVAKGDPLDVAAYAAFCWHHNWTTSTVFQPHANVARAEVVGALDRVSLDLKRLSEEARTRFTGDYAEGYSYALLEVSKALASSPSPASPVEPVVPGPIIKPQIIADLREWAEFEQDGGNVQQGAAIDVILDWYDRQTGFDTSRAKLPKGNGAGE